MTIKHYMVEDGDQLRYACDRKNNDVNPSHLTVVKDNITCIECKIIAKEDPK